MTYRNKALLQAARLAPICFCCERTNDGSVVACHSNSLADGKGTGHKAHDHAVFFGCSSCHAKYDRGSLPREVKREMFALAHKKTIGWLFESGIIDVVSKTGKIQGIMGKMG